MLGAQSSSAVASKHDSELAWWERELRHYVAWFNGERALYGVSPPQPHEKRLGESVESSACLTHLAKTLHRYPERLKIQPDHFAGKKILDLGCGPLPYSTAFEDCVVIGLDPLVKRYEEAGFPLAEYSDAITFVAGVAEEMPFPSRSFDALISVNSIDHVDDFMRTAREIRRVLKKDGIIRMEVRHHAPTELEPVALTDEVILAHLCDLGIEKVSDSAHDPASEYRDSGQDRKIDPGERVSVWANDADVG